MMSRSMFNPLRKKPASLLKEPTGEDYGSTSDTNSRALNSQLRSFTLSSPPILEPSKDDPRPPKPPKPNATEDSGSPPINPWRTLVTTSCNEPMMGGPVTYLDPPNDPSEDQSADLQDPSEEDMFCSTLMRGYSEATCKFKNSNFIYVFQVLLSIIPISAIVMGLIFWNQCCAIKALPVWGAMLGAYGVVFIALWMVASYYIRRGRNIREFKICVLMTLGTFVLFTFTDLCIFFATSVSFDEKSDRYCDKTFYSYVFYKQIATGVAVDLTFMLYLPTCIQWLTRC